MRLTLLATLLAVPLALSCQKKESSESQKKPAGGEKMADTRATGTEGPGDALTQTPNSDRKLTEDASAADAKPAEGPKAEVSDVPQDPAAPVQYAAVDHIRKQQRKYSPVHITFKREGLSEKELLLLKKLVEASRMADEIFWLQASHDGRAWRDLFARRVDPDSRVVFHFLNMNYSVYDRLDNSKPFIGTKPRPEGAGFYPADMTREEFESHIKANPQDEKLFKSGFTVIFRNPDRSLRAIPYSEVYGDHLRAMQQPLFEAIELTDNDTLKRFLKSRGEALLTNDYYQSDKDWVDLNARVEITIGPYEVYEDSLFGYKTSFESFVTVRDVEESNKLSIYESWLDKMETNLPIPDQFKNFKRGKSSPLVVAELVFSAGDTRAGIQTIAFNLPNDPRVQEEKGSKKVMLHNVMNAKFEKILTPIAERVLAPELLPLLNSEAFFNHTVVHEISHALGPSTIKVNGVDVSVNEALKEKYSHLEEAKADTLGMFNAFFLIDSGVMVVHASNGKGGTDPAVALTPEEAKRVVAVTFLAGIFRSTRFGVEEAHGKANLIIFNYLYDKGAFAYDSTGRITLDMAKLLAALPDLARDILMIQAEGSYEKAVAFIEKYGKVSDPMAASLASLQDLPVDIEPIFENL